MHKAPRNTQNAKKKRRSPQPSYLERKNQPCAHVVKQHISCPQRTRSSMLPDPTELYFNPLLFQTGIRSVKKLVLALTIHDQKITMFKPTRASFTIQTGLAIPLEKRTGTKAHRHTEIRTPKGGSLSLCHPRFPSLVKVQVRSSRHIPLSTPRHH